VALELYRKKRKFGVTPEPRGRQARRKGDLYLIQKHAATRLHYDFRLELDGVLKSWAVTRGPSLAPGEKRLAVHVEDHPLEYGEFEGTIPKGQYGGGTVMLWDRGRWIPEGDPREGYKKGHLTFTLDGVKLKGRWHLVRMKKRPGEKHENWLLIKGEDEYARAPGDPDILEEMPLSVATGRTMEEIAAGKKPKIRSKVKAAAVWNSVARSEKIHAPPASMKPAERTRSKARPRQDMGGRASARPPDFVAPCLARLASVPPDGRDWIHEIKFDGYRMLARLDHGKVKLLTRKGLDWTAKFPDVAEAVARLPAKTALLDGEIVVEDEKGISSFSLLQSALKEGRRGCFLYYVFDLLHRDGVDLAKSPLLERKAALKDLVAGAPGGGSIRLSEHLTDRGAVVLAHACQMKLEGIVSKRIDAPYRSGRTGDWVKTKCADRQEFVVGGFTLAKDSRRAVGALAVGYYENGRLRYAGRIGTGFTHTMAADLWKRLDKLRVDKPPFDELPAEEKRRRDVIWVKPKLVIEAAFRGWTGHDLLRQAAFKGVREDKSPTEVVRETPADIGTGPDETDMSKSAKGRAARTAKPTTKAALAKRTAAVKDDAKTQVRFTNPDRVYWSDVDITKQGLADYCTDVWDWMAPHVVRRPLALLRCPSGVGSECFVQKHAHATFDRKRILSVDDHGEELIAIETLDGMLALVQAGVLEVHVWGSTIDRVDVCDRMVFDLDPGPGVGWPAVIEGARELRERLRKVGLESFLKTSGGKGLHIVVPFDGADWTTTKEFTKQIALQMSADSPTKYLAKMTKSARQGRIFIDYLRNGRGATAVAAYSPRARPGAPVSAPIDWRELTSSMTPDRFSILNIRSRLKRLRQDPWKDIGRIRQKLPAAAAAKKKR
jgi:bifunctional non-homologous end joining protein LigD